MRTGRGGEREAQAPPAKGASAVGMCGRSGSMPSGDSLHDHRRTISDVRDSWPLQAKTLHAGGSKSRCSIWQPTSHATYAHGSACLPCIDTCGWAMESQLELWQPACNHQGQGQGCRAGSPAGAGRGVPSEGCRRGATIVQRVAAAAHGGEAAGQLAEPIAEAAVEARGRAN